MAWKHPTKNDLGYRALGLGAYLHIHLYRYLTRPMLCVTLDGAQRPKYVANRITLKRGDLEFKNLSVLAFYGGRYTLKR